MCTCVAAVCTGGYAGQRLSQTLGVFNLVALFSEPEANQLHWPGDQQAPRILLSRTPQAEIASMLPQLPFYTGAGTPG